MKHLMRALMTSCRTSQRHVAAFILVVAAFVGLAGPGCSSSSDTTTKLFTNCTLNSDCNSGLLCTLGQCRPACKTVADCMGGGSCIFDNAGHAVCQSPKENNTPCDIVTMPCTAPLACASDFRCRNLCDTDAKCNVLGITGRVCATDATGTHYCADPAIPGEVTGGKITQPPPPGAGAMPDGGNTGSNDATTGGQDGTTVGPDGATPAGDSSVTDGGTGGSICNPPCGNGFECVNGACAACGTVAGAPCCGGTTCTANLTCSNGTCSCGQPGLACCGGSMCNNSVTCIANVCACGGAGQACCPAGMEAAAGCTSPVQCAGITCSCLVACSGNLVQRTDGSLWSSSTVPVTTGTGAKFIATSFSAGGSLACGAQSDGSAWCWGTNSYGQLGVGGLTPTSSTLPVKVVTDMSGTPLANVVKVFVEPYNSYSACAVDKNGAAWCWGYNYYGQLGTGDTNNAPFATPVKLPGSGAQLTGVDQIEISNDHACARKTDKSLWCWGSNQYGQIGVGADPTTSPRFLNPVQVTALFNNVLNVTVGGNASCATTSDGSVYCWGSNSQGVLGNGLNTGFANVPAQVLTSGDSGATFTGAIQVQLMYYGYAACALKGADRSIWCWGSYSSAQKYFPVPYTEMSSLISNVFVLCGDQPNSASPAFIDAKAAFHQNGYLQNPQVPCQ